MENALLFILAGIACGWWLRESLPSALLRWHDLAVCIWHRWISRRCGGRPRLDPELIGLIRQMSFENPLWGAPRIHGELLKLGFS